MRTIDADALLCSMGEPKDYVENIIYNVVKDFVDRAPTVRTSEPKTARWIWQTYTNGFGTFKELCCGECYHKRQQVDLHFCACCGAKMTNADEFGGAT